MYYSLSPLLTHLVETRPSFDGVSTRRDGNESQTQNACLHVSTGDTWFQENEVVMLWSNVVAGCDSGGGAFWIQITIAAICSRKFLFLVRTSSLFVRGVGNGHTQKRGPINTPELY